ncbi:MAG: hypothetical protein K0R78_690 [Pelosinus sp.]|jgi:hypothetical protein|nr:hypothetical protein [Pelosinus sp.]
MEIITNEFKKGDVLYVSVIRPAGFGPLHYGVYDGYGGVFHFNGITPDTAFIHYSLLKDFANGGTVKIDPCVKSFSPDEIVERASGTLGDNFGGFNLLTNNCEHFAKWCAMGVRQSTQIIEQKKNIVNIGDRLTRLSNKVSQSIKNGMRIFGN